MKVLEGLISRWITRLYCIFATFPTRGPRGLLCYVRQPRPSLLSGRNPMALPGTRGGVGASLTFLIQKNTTFFHLPAKPLEWVRTFHTSFPVLCTVSSPLWNARSYNVASSLANLHSIALHTARLAVVGPRLWAPLRMRTCVCAVAPPQPTPPLTFMPTLTSEMSPCQLWLIYTINIRWVSRFANFPFRGKTRVGGKAAFSQQRVSQVRTQDWKGLFPQKSSPGTLYCCCCFDTLLIPLKGRRRGHGHLRTLHTLGHFSQCPGKLLEARIWGPCGNTSSSLISDSEATGVPMTAWKAIRKRGVHCTSEKKKGFPFGPPLPT